MFLWAQTAPETRGAEGVVSGSTPGHPPPPPTPPPPTPRVLRFSNGFSYYVPQARFPVIRSRYRTEKCFMLLRLSYLPLNRHLTLYRSFRSSLANSLRQCLETPSEERARSLNARALGQFPRNAPKNYALKNSPITDFPHPGLGGGVNYSAVSIQVIVSSGSTWVEIRVN